MDKTQFNNTLFYLKNDLHYTLCTLFQNSFVTLFCLSRCWKYLFGHIFRLRKISTAGCLKLYQEYKAYRIQKQKICSIFWSLAFHWVTETLPLPKLYIRFYKFNFLTALFFSPILRDFCIWTYDKKDIQFFLRWRPCTFIQIQNSPLLKVWMGLCIFVCLVHQLKMGIGGEGALNF